MPVKDACQNGGARIEAKNRWGKAEVRRWKTAPDSIYRPWNPAVVPFRARNARNGSGQRPNSVSGTGSSDVVFQR